MSNVGSYAANFHEGSRSEYLAQYVFASFGTAISVPQQEDTGIDLQCTLTERVGRRAWPRYHYSVQVKSTMSAWRFDSPESVRWLVEHPLPLFLCVVDKSTARLRLYHTLPRFFVWATGTLTDSLELVPENDFHGKSTQWSDGTKFSLSAPIIDRTIIELMDDSIWEEVRSVIEFWLKIEQRNREMFTMNVPVFSMPDGYETNTTNFTGTVFQGDALPHRVDNVRAPLGKILEWLIQAYSYKHDLRGTARVALLLRYLFPENEGTEAPSMPLGYTEINKALGLKSKYLFEGVDTLSQRLDGMLRQTGSGDAR
jgi:hypothetical protein